MHSPQEHLNAQQMRRDQLDAWIGLWSRHRTKFQAAMIVLLCLVLATATEPHLIFSK